MTDPEWISIGPGKRCISTFSLLSGASTQTTGFRHTFSTTASISRDRLEPTIGGTASVTRESLKPTFGAPASVGRVRLALFAACAAFSKTWVLVLSLTTYALYSLYTGHHRFFRCCVIRKVNNLPVDVHSSVSLCQWRNWKERTRASVRCILLTQRRPKCRRSSRQTPSMYCVPVLTWS